MDEIKKVLLFFLALIWVPLSCAQQIVMHTFREIGRIELQPENRTTQVILDTAKWAVVLVVFLLLLLVISRFRSTKWSKLLYGLLLIIMVADSAIWIVSLIVYLGLVGEVYFGEWIIVNVVCHLAIVFIAIVTIIKRLAAKSVSKRARVGMSGTDGGAKTTRKENGFRGTALWANFPQDKTRDR